MLCYLKGHAFRIWLVSLGILIDWRFPISSYSFKPTHTHRFGEYRYKFQMVQHWLAAQPLLPACCSITLCKYKNQSNSSNGCASRQPEGKFQVTLFRSYSSLFNVVIQVPFIRFHYQTSINKVNIWSTAIANSHSICSFLFILIICNCNSVLVFHVFYYLLNSASKRIIMTILVKEAEHRFILGYWVERRGHSFPSQDFFFLLLRLKLLKEQQWQETVC